MSDPDYDISTGMYGVFNKQDFKIPETPTKQDALKSLEILCGLLDEFSFREGYDKAAALSAILTAAVRPSLVQSPMIHVKASMISSGKSYLTSLISSFASPMITPAMAFPKDDEECLKILVASLLTSPAAICFDNLTTDLIPHKSLCSTLTEPFITGRILGVSKTATVGTRTLFLSSGNNVEPVRDMTRRTVTITLDPMCEKPAERDFKSQPVELVKVNRGKYVSLALTIVRAWIVAGRPCVNVKNLATYTDWSGLCRQSLMWLGQPDPATSVFLGMDADPDREILGQLLHSWHERFSNRPTMMRDAIINSTEDLRAAFMEIAGDNRGDLNKNKLGRWIVRHSGRLVDGLRFIKDSSTRNAAIWIVESSKSIKSINLPSSSKFGISTHTESESEMVEVEF